MPSTRVSVKMIGESHRLVDFLTGQIALKNNLEPWDGGGYSNAMLAIQDASLINAGILKDNTKPPGKQGERGASGRDGRSLNWRGEWRQTDQYGLYDLVKFEGSVFIYISQTRGNAAPKNEKFWELFVEKGEPGKNGASSQGFGGLQGPPGMGVPTGGTTGQVLAKASEDNFVTEWVDPSGGGGVPIGGNTGQALVKSSNANYDTEWATVATGAVPVSGETSGSITSASANKQVNCSAGITLDSSVFTAGDIILFDSGGSDRTFTRGSGAAMFMNGTDVPTATLSANMVGMVRVRTGGASSVFILSGGFL